MAEFDSKDVMAYILTKCENENIFVNLTKLEKLLYCCYGAILAKYDARLTSEHPQAWPYGPVFPQTFIAFRNGEITAGQGNSFRQNCPPEWLSLIDEVIAVFGKYKASQLSAWSHKEGSPWYKASSGGRVMQAPLDDFQIRQYFRENVLEEPNESTKN